MKIKTNKEAGSYIKQRKNRFYCLNGRTKKICKVRYCIAGELHFVDCSSEKSCFYKEPFAGSFICMSAARKDIYNKYKI